MRAGAASAPTFEKVRRARLGIVTGLDRLARERRGYCPK
jgi:hypothetical protein